MNWLITALTKEARGRRFRTDDKIRFFTDKLKGKGKDIVLAPRFHRGTVVDFDSETRQYRIRNNSTNEEVYVHPRNLVPDSIIQQQPYRAEENIVPLPPEIISPV